MVTEGDTGYYLRVMATYTDAAGTDIHGDSQATMMADRHDLRTETDKATAAGMDIGDGRPRTLTATPWTTPWAVQTRPASTSTRKRAS